MTTTSQKTRSVAWNYVWAYVWAAGGVMLTLILAASGEIRLGVAGWTVASFLSWLLTTGISIVFCRRVFTHRTATGEDRTGFAGFLMIYYFLVFGCCLFAPIIMILTFLTRLTQR